MTEFILLAIFTWDNSLMMINKAHDDPLACEAAMEIIIQKYEARAMGDWDLRYIKCTRTDEV